MSDSNNLVYCLRFVDSVFCLHGLSRGAIATSSFPFVVVPLLNNHVDATNLSHPLSLNSAVNWLIWVSSTRSSYPGTTTNDFFPKSDEIFIEIWSFQVFLANPFEQTQHIQISEPSSAIFIELILARHMDLLNSGVNGKATIKWLKLTPWGLGLKRFTRDPVALDSTKASVLILCQQCIEIT